jgi:hypothetical protein
MRWNKSDHRRTAWDVQKGWRRPQDAHPVGGLPQKQPLRRFRGGPLTRHRRVGHGGTRWNFRESMAWPPLAIPRLSQKTRCSHENCYYEAPCEWNSKKLMRSGKILIRQRECDQLEIFLIIRLEVRAVWNWGLKTETDHIQNQNKLWT